MLGTYAKKNGKMWEFREKKRGGGGLPKSPFFCNLTKWFLACQTQSSTWEKFQHFPVFFGKTSLSLPDFFLEHLNFFSIKAAIQA